MKKFLAVFVIVVGIWLILTCAGLSLPHKSPRMETQRETEDRLLKWYIEHPHTVYRGQDK